jgi:hypothetical protein
MHCLLEVILIYFGTNWLRIILIQHCILFITEKKHYIGGAVGIILMRCCWLDVVAVGAVG